MLSTKRTSHTTTISSKVMPWMVLNQSLTTSRSYPLPIGGSICNNRSIYIPKGDNKVTEEGIKDDKEKASSISKAVEAYLLANPDC
ncbi:hypothetical protein Vadar_005111 [Vaccinium darrowii]|uniref:Uncharacterized protein n=1 Tax=Vaccinium darrowii TaxID=229202 RepID=A0ACB7XNE2_9ERIC|nr:hypothetical protein Vadar_005111 [Vaccinium darrowii]